MEINLKLESVFDMPAKIQVLKIPTVAVSSALSLINVLF